jgi:uncharacterized protein (DUF2062 family)
MGKYINRLIEKGKEFYHKYLPRQSHLKDTLLHRIIGERLFDEALWIPEKRSIIYAVSMGIFVAFTPTIGIQMAIAGICAFFMRCNIPTAILMVWISNPVTAIPIYSMEIKIGFIVLGNGEGFKAIHSLNDICYYIEPLIIGTIIVSTVLAGAAFILTSLLWDFVASRTRPRH